jgi:hypothetical protein
MSTEPEFTEEQLRALEAEMDRITVDEVLVQTMVSLLNLGARKAGLAGGMPGGPPPTPDWEQARQAIDAVRALVPMVEPRHPEQGRALRDMLSQLQMAYARMAPAGAGEVGAGDAPEPPAGGPGPAAGPQPEGPAADQAPEGPGPAQRSGRLWIPGQ